MTNIGGNGFINWKTKKLYSELKMYVEVSV